MAVPQELLQQLLALDESDRIEIAEALLDSVEFWLDEPDMDPAERRKLNAAINQSLRESDAGQTVPFDDVMASLRAKQALRAAR